MIEKRPSHQRGATELGWLESRHSFSFGGYYDAQRVRHGALRVLNDDVVAGGQGFGAHPHRNAEIVSYVLSGQLEHKDSLGNGNVITAGQFQYMSAGRGVTHSEFNPIGEPSHFLQIWLLPNEHDAKPTYGQADAAELPEGPLARVASGESCAPIHWRADADLWLGRPTAGQTLALPSRGGHGYLHVTRGAVRLTNAANATTGDSEALANGLELSPGDAAATEGEPTLSLTATADAEFLWFDQA